MTNVKYANLTTLDVGRPSSSAGEEWQSFKILFHDFADLPSAVGQCTRSPEFTCNGHRWCIKLYPSGHTEARAGNLSLYLRLCSGGYATATFEVSVLDKYQSIKRIAKSATLRSFSSESKTWGWPQFVSRSYILNQANNYLDDNGTLAVVVSIQRDSASAAPFVPSNPIRGMIAGMFLDEKTADVCFEVGSADVHDGDEAAPSPVTFHAHSFILKTCAPMLASLFGSDDDEVATATITDVKPDIFHHMLHYVYGGSVPDAELNTHVKDIINAADKYSIVNLKLEAEAAYVKSTKITMDNVIDNLLYADSMNLALLKEAVMDFLAENHDEAVTKDFSNIPGHLMRDLLVAFGMSKRAGKGNGKEKDFKAMRVSELRMKLAKAGLDVDGSREAMRPENPAPNSVPKKNHFAPESQISLIFQKITTMTASTPPYAPSTTDGSTNPYHPDNLTESISTDGGRGINYLERLSSCLGLDISCVRW
ncbi:BTB/POZ and MATH domain-containing protein [Skeletonema marinoi]|uniref:BTB/POZ and MATH domain-containing protein n=1 Tax=Skeletonema marinoi TaxID=267567 RepID=A0AAD9DB10_9STRA|nr:BTB/POZ and MATH domain-containing protein [Skeletonema marinoi]